MAQFPAGCVTGNYCKYWLGLEHPCEKFQNDPKTDPQLPQKTHKYTQRQRCVMVRAQRPKRVDSLEPTDRQSMTINRSLRALHCEVVQNPPVAIRVVLSVDFDESSFQS